MADEKTEADKDMARLSGLAKRMGLDGSDLTRFLHEGMTKLGYKSRRSYFSEEKNKGGGGGLFGSSKSSADDDDDDF